MLSTKWQEKTIKVVEPVGHQPESPNRKRELLSTVKDIRLLKT